MTRYKTLIGATAVTFALSVLPAGAQRPGGGGQGSGGGERPSGGGSSGPGGTSGGGGGNVGGGSGGSSSGGGSMSSPSSGGGDSSSAPSRPSAGAPTRSPRAGGAPDRRTGDRAVPRGSSGGDSSRGAARVGSAGAVGSTAGSTDRVTNPADRAVPAHSRPREGRPTTGTAVPREFPPARGFNDRYYSYYAPYGRYMWPGYGFGLGYSYYDPFWFDSYDSYYGGYGGYGGGYAYQGSGSARVYRDTGSLKLKIKPRDAKVHIDGYFVGLVDSFDGLFQRLDIESGGHRIEIRADGYEPLQFEVLITPGESVTYKGELKRIQ